MTVDVAELLIKAEAQGVTQSQKALDSLTSSSQKAESATNKLNTETEKSDKSFSAASAGAKLLTGAIAGVAASISVSKIVDYTNRWTDLNSMLVNATGSQEAADRAMQGLSATARSTYSSLEATADAFLRNSMTMTELGYTTEQQINLSDALNNSLVISGTKGQQAESVMQALSKAFATGTLRGENFNSVIANGGRTVQALADGLGVGTLELRAMAEAGELTTGRVIDALTSQMETLRGEAERMPATIGDGFLLLGNAIFETVGRMDGMLGSSSAVSESIVDLSDYIKAFSGDADRMRSVIDGVTASGQILAAVLVARMMPALGQTIAGYYASATALAAKTAAMGTATAAATALRGAMTLLGGPAGIAIIAAAGIYKLATSIFGADEKAQGATESITELTAAIKEFNYETAEADSLTEGLKWEIQQASLALSQAASIYGVNSGEVRRLTDRIDTLNRELTTHQNKNRASAAATVETTKAVVEHTGRTAEQIAELRKAAVALDHGTFSTAAQTEAVNTLIGSLSVVRMSYADNIAMMNQAQWVMEGVTESTYYASKATDFWTAVSEDGAKRRTAAEEAAARQMQENWQRTHEYMTNAFIDIWDNGSSAFENIADSFKAMVKRMVAEWAASGLMNLFGIGSGVAGATGGILGGSGAAGGLISGIKGAISGGIAGITPLGWAALGLGAAGIIHNKTSDPDNYKRSLAGFATAPLDPSVASRVDTFGVDPFASGFMPTGVALRASQQQAMANIDIFRAVDQRVVDAVAALGGSVDLSRATLSGVGTDGKAGTGGTFLGVGGKTTEQDLSSMLNRFAAEVLRHAQGIDQDVMTRAMSAGTADAMISVLAQTAEEQARANEELMSQIASSGPHVAEREQAQASQNMAAAVHELTNEISALRSELVSTNSSAETQRDEMLSNDTRIGQALQAALVAIERAISAIPAGAEVTR